MGKILALQIQTMASPPRRHLDISSEGQLLKVKLNCALVSWLSCLQTSIFSPLVIYSVSVHARYFAGLYTKLFKYTLSSKM